LYRSTYLEDEAAEIEAVPLGILVRELICGLQVVQELGQRAIELIVIE
jgi:hypothetical protein